jgi:cytochrome c biogenesis protein CcdA
VEPALLLFAFSAGAIGFFAPCCIAMLPAYVGYAVRTPDAPALASRAPWARTLALAGLAPITLGGIPLLTLGIASYVPIPFDWTRLFPDEDVSVLLLVLGLAATTTGVVLAGRGPAALRGALFGTLATLGFLTIFLAIGLPIAFLARGLAPYLNWLAVLVGILLVLLGAFVLAGKALSIKLPGIKADVSTPRGFYVFGLGYGIASLSCTFPVFLAVLFAGTLSGGALATLAMFAAYALGKGALLIGVTILTIAGGATAGNRVRRYAPHMTRAGGAILVLAGLYIAYYFGRFAPGLGTA